MSSFPRIRSDLSNVVPKIDPWQLDLIESYCGIRSRFNLDLPNYFDSVVANLMKPIEVSLFWKLLDANRIFSSLLDTVFRPFPELTNPKAKVAEEQGWVIHHTLPSAILDETSDESLDAAILAFYREEWQGVKKEIEDDLQGYLIGQDSKEIMKQALRGHEEGLHRLVPRAVLPEIEAMARDQFSKNVSDKINMREQVDNFSEFPISCMKDLTSGMSGYRAAKQFLYRRIDNEDDRIEAATNPIPNRHAAVHGLIPYATEKTGLNSIFLADFVCHMITELKKDMIIRVTSVLRSKRPSDS